VPLIREIRQRVGKVSSRAPFQPGDADAVENALGSLRLRANNLARGAASAATAPRRRYWRRWRMRPGTRAPGCGKCSPTSCRSG